MGGYIGGALQGVAGGMKDKKKKDDDKGAIKRTYSASDVDPRSIPPTFKRGGKVLKTGMAKVHKGERVLTKAQAKKRGRGKA